MIELTNITLFKGGRRTFENFSFRVGQGEHWIIQGRNGSGKTLLLQLLAGAIYPQSGKVRHSFISGNDWDTVYVERLEKIHFIPTHWIQAFLSGFDGLFYQQRYYTMDETKLPTVRDVLGSELAEMHNLPLSSNFDITPLLDLPITRLSNGQLKKVVILRQLAKNIPKVLLMDYPFDGLDVQSRTDLIALIEEISMRFAIQIILTDHGGNIPLVINRKLVLENFRILSSEAVTTTRSVPVPASGSVSHIVTAQHSPVVEMRDLTIAYGGKKILSHFNWRINKGERWALTGRNGSGKTTLFSLIYADHPMAYSQQVFLFGRRRGSGESIWDIKRRINYLGPEQIHFLNPKTITLTARQYVERQPHKNVGRLESLIRFFSAGNWFDLPVKSLSSGQLQMVMLINMFVDERELLLLDEPFQFLDPENHERVTQYLTQYLDQAITLVLITHDEKDVSRWTQLRKNL